MSRVGEVDGGNVEQEIERERDTERKREREKRGKKRECTVSLEAMARARWSKDTRTEPCFARFRNGPSAVFARGY